MSDFLDEIMVKKDVKNEENTNLNNESYINSKGPIEKHRFKCYYCETVLKTKKLFKRHLIFHNGEKPFLW